MGGQLRAGRRSVWECGLESGKAVAGWVALPTAPRERGSGLRGTIGLAVRETVRTGLIFLKTGKFWVSPELQLAVKV